MKTNKEQTENQTQQSPEVGCCDLLAGLFQFQRDEIRNAICRQIMDANQDVCWTRQGELMARLGLTAYEAKYPSDTYVGVARLKGWEKVNSRLANVKFTGRDVSVDETVKVSILYSSRKAWPVSY